ncbi:hypothetical protein ACH5RR_012810 [Cinchona calisaya]|uniref:Uncharacterized protein n=1 Tax=Cinchona calisaya TaxID=153742 RepID=A0ABD3AAA1_9GENT
MIGQWSNINNSDQGRKENLNLDKERLVEHNELKVAGEVEGGSENMLSLGKHIWQIGISKLVEVGVEGHSKEFDSFEDRMHVDEKNLIEVGKETLRKVSFG